MSNKKEAPEKLWLFLDNGLDEVEVLEDGHPDAVLYIRADEQESNQ